MELVKFAETECASCNGKPQDSWKVLVFVEKDNIPARRLYLACGFEEMSEDEYTNENGKKGIAIALKRDLRGVDT